MWNLYNLRPAGMLEPFPNVSSILVPLAGYQRQKRITWDASILSRAQLIPYPMFQSRNIYGFVRDLYHRSVPKSVQNLMFSAGQSRFERNVKIAYWVVPCGFPHRNRKEEGRDITPSNQSKATVSPGGSASPTRKIVT